MLDDKDRQPVDKQVGNEREEVLEELEPHRRALGAVAIESTFNWCWLADGLEDHGYRVQLVNPSAAKQYEGTQAPERRTRCQVDRPHAPAGDPANRQHHGP